MVYCSAAEQHWYCSDCFERYANDLAGKQQWNLLCIGADNACHSDFARRFQEENINKDTLRLLDRLHTRHAISGLDNVEECPFCDFLAVLDPPDVADIATWWFKCHDPKCLKVSCRMCRGADHYGKSCDAALKKGKGKALPATASKEEKAAMLKKLVEEARTKAKIRSCNRCKTSFVKEEGCNSIRCTKCGNNQCYSCGKDIKGHDGWHFGSASDGKCVLYDNSISLDEVNLKKAEKEAIQQVLREHPELDPKNLEVKFSHRIERDAVLHEENYEQRLRNMVGNISC
jgi:TRIAD3 protein (E3 ubiquitin-protein ligase RNF216)